MVVEIVIAVVGLGAGWLFGRRGAARAPKEPTCTGYRALVIDEKGKPGRQYSTMNDCRGLRSPTCMDGRCTMHCRESCKCDASNAPEFIGRSQQRSA